MGGSRRPSGGEVGARSVQGDTPYLEMNKTFNFEWFRLSYNFIIILSTVILPITLLNLIINHTILSVSFGNGDVCSILVLFKLLYCLQYSTKRFELYD